MRRIVAAACVVGAVVAIVIIFLGGSKTHVLHVQFTDAGQLVTGDRVTVATRPIGHITKLSLTPDGRAEWRDANITYRRMVQQHFASVLSDTDIAALQRIISKLDS